MFFPNIEMTFQSYRCKHQIVNKNLFSSAESPKHCLQDDHTVLLDNDWSHQVLLDMSEPAIATQLCLNQTQQDKAFHFPRE